MNGPNDLAQIQTAAKHFLGVFDNFEWEPFCASWASEPTVFFPFDDTPERVSGQAAVEARFRRFFDEVRARKSGPPYLHIQPRELRVQQYGDAGLVTFMLDQPPVLGGPPLARRTLLFVREKETWKLAHLHASAAGQR
jgi:ketosteroid isomerase-like protein